METSPYMLEVTPTESSISTKNVPVIAEGLISDSQFMIFTKTSLAVWLLISVFGICTNIINIRTFIRMSPDDSVTILFLALSISDFLICNLSFGEASSSIFDIVAWDLRITWSLPPNIPRLYIFTARRILSVVTICITSFLALQRCLCVIIPFHVKGMFSRRLTYIFLGAAFIFAFVPYCLYVAQYKVVKFQNAETGKIRYKLGYRGLRSSFISLTSIGMGIVLNVTAQVLINTCLIVMRYGLVRSVQFRKVTATSAYSSSEPEQQQHQQQSKSNAKTSGKEKQALLQVSIVSIIFVLTNVPYLLNALAMKIEPRIDFYSTYRNLYVVMFRSMTIIEIVNSSFNFFVYLKYNSRFRKLCF